MSFWSYTPGHLRCKKIDYRIFCSICMRTWTQTTQRAKFIHDIAFSLSFDEKTPFFFLIFFPHFTILCVCVCALAQNKLLLTYHLHHDACYDNVHAVVYIFFCFLIHSSLKYDNNNNNNNNNIHKGREKLSYMILRGTVPSCIIVWLASFLLFFCCFFFVQKIELNKHSYVRETEGKEVP